MWDKGFNEMNNQIGVTNMTKESLIEEYRAYCKLSGESAARGEQILADHFFKKAQEFSDKIKNFK